MKRSAIISLVFAGACFSTSAAAVQPIGYLDGAGCEVVGGWAQDPDIPDSPIDVHVYFNGPAGTPGAPAIGVRADVHRDDLCAAIGSCAHGYYVASPFALHDGAPHDVYAYGIDNAGEGNPVLGNSPRVLQCAPAAQSGIRRKIEDVPALEAWRFSTFWDVLPLAPTDAEQLAEGLAMPERPELIQADDGSPEVYLVDHGVRRPITPNEVATWRLDLGQIVKTPAAEVKAMPEGTALRPRPIVFVHGGLYVVDDPQPFVIPPSSSSSSSSSSSTSGGITPDDVAPTSACSYVASSSSNSNWFFLTIPAFLAVFRRRRLRVPTCKKS